MGDGRLNSKERGNVAREPLAVPRLCVTIGRYWYLFKRLTALSAGRFSRFEHIAADSSGKVVAKSVDSARWAQSDHSRGLKALTNRALALPAAFADINIHKNDMAKQINSDYRNASVALETGTRRERDRFSPLLLSPYWLPSP